MHHCEYFFLYFHEFAVQAVGEQVRDELVNVNKMPTNLEGSVVESAFFGVFSQKTAGLLYLWRTVE